MLSAAATAAWYLSPVVLIAGWALAGAGMGLMYPRLTVLTLAYSTPQNQGFNSSALSISDAIGASAAIAAMELTFVRAGGDVGGVPGGVRRRRGVALAGLIPGLRLGLRRRAALTDQFSARPSRQ